ncbi:TetR/AcrR family transcriptional regulator [Rhodococcus sp. IEGM1428]|uniref:TetR/AcrR family transcriptional regulator n=1 Tax=Rhodococcus sp. IEGM1428 TaxID=3392191 RepID=UPI003D0979AD
MSILTARVSSTPANGHLPPEFEFSGTRERIVLAALDRFAEVGYGATSIRDIASAVKLNSATLYSHFESKEAILVELVTIGHRAHHARLLKAVLSSAGHPRAQLEALARAHVHFHCEYARLAVVANAEMHALPETVAAPALALRSQAVAMLIDILERGQASGEFQLLRVDVTAAAVAALGRQAAHWFPSDSVPVNADALADHYSALVMRMVAPWPAS